MYSRSNSSGTKGQNRKSVYAVGSSFAMSEKQVQAYLEARETIRSVQRNSVLISPYLYQASTVIGDAQSGYRKGSLNP